MEEQGKLLKEAEIEMIYSNSDRNRDGLIDY
jgi:hypothetical protein